MSDVPPTRQAQGYSANDDRGRLTAPRRRSALDCQTCGAPFKSRGGLSWHRIRTHLLVSNALGNIPSAGPSGRGGGSSCGAGEGQAGSGGDDAGNPGSDDTAADAVMSGGERGASGGATNADHASGGDMRSDQGGMGGPASSADADAESSATGVHHRTATDAGETVLEESSVVRAAFDPTKDLSKQVQCELLALMVATREEVHEEETPAVKRRRLAAGAPREKEYTYSTVSTAVRAIYESEGDWENAVPIVERRNGWRAGRFDSVRLRALQRFALQSGGAGLSLQWLEGLYDLMDTWDGTKPGMPIDDKHKQPIRDAFGSVNAFKDSMRDDVDDAALGAGWKKCTLVVDGERYVALFRPVLDVVLGMLNAGKTVRLWSGENGPAPPTEQRESPLDGDAFRKNEEALMEEKRDGKCFVLGLHVFSDASQLSWSGGTLLERVLELYPDCGLCLVDFCALWYDDLSTRLHAILNPCCVFCMPGSLIALGAIQLTNCTPSACGWSMSSPARLSGSRWRIFPWLESRRSPRQTQEPARGATVCCRGSCTWHSAPPLVPVATASSSSFGATHMRRSRASCSTSATNQKRSRFCASRAANASSRARRVWCPPTLQVHRPH